MKKLLTTLCVLLVGITPIFAYATITVTVTAAKADDSQDAIGGTVTLTKTKASSEEGNSLSTAEINPTISNFQAKGSDGFWIISPAYDPIITLTPTASKGYYVEGIYQVVNEEETLVGFAEFEITSSSDATYIYKVKFAKLPDGVSLYINSSTSLTGLETGTEGPSTTFPCKPKWQVNLASTFDESGKALFDQLFIFGETTFNGSVSASTSVTPCYKFTKSDESTYRFSDFVPNVNTASKASMFNITATEGMKIYATGWCPSGSCGYRPEDNGLFYIKGAAGVSVHLYIEDCYMYLRAHTKSGTLGDILTNEHLYKEAFIPRNKADVRPSVPGIASSVVFECTSTSSNSGNPFKPYVHVRGNNLMYGHRGTHFNLDISAITDLIGMDVNPIIGQYSAALSVKIGNDGKGPGLNGTATSNSYTTLTLDDKWPTSATGGESTHTNGYLKFEKEWNASPSIDLGNQNTVLNFDGGRFELQANLPTQAQYINNLTICYRTGFVDLLGGVYVMSGVGGESTQGTVNINDGSVYVTPFNAMHQDILYFWCLPGYFEDAEIDGTGKVAMSRILRCPAKTYVTGGSHPGDIRACDDQNASGNAPKDKKTGHLLKQVKIPTSSFTNGQLLKAEEFASVFPSSATIECGYPSDLCKVTSPHEQTYAQYYGSPISYGANSIAPQDGYIYLWLPGHGKHSITYVPWEVFFPETTFGISDYTQSIGASNTVSQEFYGDNTTVKKKLQNMLFVDIDDNMKSFIYDNYQTSKFPVQVAGYQEYMYVSPEGQAEDAYHKSIANETDYTVYNSIYYVTTAVADEWMLFCPPFDVTNVYVLETANEELLAKKAAEKDGRDAALLIQSKYNLDAMTIVGANMVSNDKAIQFWEHYSGFNNYVQAVRMYKNSGKTDNTDMNTAAEYYADDNGTSWSGAIGSVVNYTKLVHLSQTDSKYNYDQAHYYLYKQGAGNFTEWGEGNTFLRTNWELADANITGVNGTTYVMKKGEVYAMQFPYCPGCEKEGKDRDYWDYWTGKMLVFEGIGENTIGGTGSLTDIVTSTLADGLHGNSTLSDITNNSDDNFNGVENLYFNSTDILNQFSKVPPEQLNPGDAFLKLSAPMSMPGKRIKSINAETGSITWEEDNSNDGTTTGTPTISGNRQMMVYTIDGGVGIIPVTAQQVSIYNAAGQLITSQYLSEEVQISLPAGIYLISGEKEQAKAIVR